MIIPDLWPGILFGLGIAFMYAALHLILLRILWQPLLEQKRYARWVHLVLCPVIMLLVLVAIGLSETHLILLGYSADSILPTVTAGLTIYFLAFFILLYPKLWVKKPGQEPRPLPLTSNTLVHRRAD